LSAGCFAAFVRRKRGHLLHASKCIKREKYRLVPQVELEGRGGEEEAEDTGAGV